MLHVLQLRGGLLETQHPVAVACWRGGAAGGLDRAVGADHHSTWRSAAKPFQLAAALAAMEGAAASENTPFTLRSLSDEELAIGAASHAGQPGHTALVSRLLDRFGLSVEALRCGAEAPLHRPSHAALLRAGQAPTALHNDCSGKHSFMLGACRARGWSTDGYLAATHPLQQRVLRALDAVAGARLAHGTDGCGLPAVWLSLAAMARAWSVLACAMADPDEDPVLARVGQAMADNPWLTSGDGRLDLALARRAREPYVGKIGALAVHCVALPDRSAGVAIKVLSGDEDALAVAVPAILDRLFPGALAPPEGPWPWATVPNVVGRPVGQRVVTGLDRV